MNETKCTCDQLTAPIGWRRTDKTGHYPDCPATAPRLTYRQALEKLSPETLTRLFTYNAVRREIEKIEAGGFKRTNPERVALERATLALQESLSDDAAEIAMREKSHGQVIEAAFREVFIHRK